MIIMADTFDTPVTTGSSSIPPEHDDISRFLHQILLRSSSPSTVSHEMQAFSPSHFFPENQLSPISTAGLFSRGLNTSSCSSSIAPSLSTYGAYFPMNMPSSSVGTNENDLDDYDCKSEGFEALMEDAPTNPTPRTSSKRSRAAEVHNMSEKRRRNRINEKLKALQNLIPNSNKTDKASMLDEAIEYLKQLQLQVQMLTMRNGLSLYPMGALQPNQPSQMRMGFNEGNRSMHVTSILQTSQETLPISMFSSLNQCINPSQPLVPNLADIINPNISVEEESLILARHGPFQLQKPSKRICREGVLPRQQLNVDHSVANSDSSSIPFSTQAWIRSLMP